MSRVVDLWHRKDRTRTARYGKGRRWMGVWTDGTGRMVRTTHDTKSGAQAWLRDQDTAHATGSLADQERGRRTVAEVWQAWQATRLRVSPRTRQDDQWNWGRHIEPMWGDRAVGSITREEVQAWVGVLTDQYAARTVDTIVRRLTGLMSWCVANRYITANPAAGLELPKGNKREHYYLTAGEFRRVQAGLPEWARDAVLVAATTGVRPGELWELRVGDVHLGRRRLRVSRSVSHHGQGALVGPPKNGKARDVPVSDMVAAVLAARMKGRGRDALLFPSAQGHQVRENNFSRRVWKSATVAAGLEGVRFYDLRHTAASWAIRSGASVLVVQRMLGHASAAMTLDVYAGLWDDDLDRVAEGIAGVLVEADDNETTTGVVVAR